jgi:hypothetical protein
MSTGYQVLADVLQQNTDVWETLTPSPLDVDRWELVLTPDEYKEKLKDTINTVQLVNRIPVRRPSTTYHRGPRFDKWLLLAEAIHQLWIEPQYKDGFFQALEEYQAAEKGKLPNQASQGVATVSTSVFVLCLNRAGCDTIRLKAYGQKTPYTPEFISTEPASPNHRWAIHNEWDIGINFSSPYIFLFDSATGRRHGIKRYPMLVPGSRDYGTVNMKITHRNQHYEIKVYPRVVHSMKSFKSRLQATVPRTLFGVHNQVSAVANMINSLSGKEASAIGGFRIEVSVKARTLEEAVERVLGTPFMTPGYWLGIGDGPFAPMLLSARLISKRNLLDNANWVFQKAADIGILDGGSNNRPTQVQIQVLTDILNAVGWNGGIRRPTKSLHPRAWWNTVDAPPSTTAVLLHQLNEMCQSDADFKRLYLKARAQKGCIPCKTEPDNPQHRYQSNNPSPFRVRCGARGCNNKLQRSSLIMWIITLVEEEFLDGDALMEEMENETSEEEDEDDRVEIA